MKVVTRFLSNTFILTFIVCVSACATQFAPEYDKALFEGVTATNVKIMELFAAVASGTRSGTCTDRAKSYNSLIGSVDALSMQSEARPVLTNSITEKVNEYLASRDQVPMTDGVAPSANSLAQVSKQLSKMREVDCASGLSVGAVKVFRNAVTISMDQAITYEAFLNR
jgi:hypothetical protein